MTAAIAVTPTSGNIIAKETAVRVDITGASSNDASTYDVEHYPTEDPIVCHVLFEAPAGTDNKKSYTFTPSADGEHSINSFIFDVDGSWTLRLRDAANNDLATEAVTVS